MLKTELIDIINEGKMWAFIGSGVSVDAGIPDWSNLLNNVIVKLDSAISQKIIKDTNFKHNLDANNLPKCFTIIEREIGKKQLSDIVKDIINNNHGPTELIKKIAELPFEGYITTNYDNLLAKALQSIDGEWTTIGNKNNELNKVTGNPSKIVWNIHGSIDLDGDKANLVITEEDYDELYLEETKLLKVLTSLLLQKRILFIGFSFNDYEITRLLKIVKKYTLPVNPLFGFLSGVYGKANEPRRLEYFNKYNLDIIPYEVKANSHNQLFDLLEMHSSFIVNRVIQYVNKISNKPEYDPSVTGLLIYNEICLRDNKVINESMLAVLVKARLLSLAKHKTNLTLSQFIDDISDKIRNLSNSLKNDLDIKKQILDILHNLITEKIIDKIELNNINSIIKLTPTGNEFVDDKIAKGEVFRDKFRSSIEKNISEYFTDTLIITKLVNIIEEFIVDSVEKRSLGVAMALTNKGNFNDYHIVALLQSLPNYMKKLNGNEEAIVLSKVIRRILSNPSESESSYIGLILQAKFGVHLLGYDENTLSIRIKEVQESVFLIDSSTIIPFIARSSIGYESSKDLITKLLNHNSLIVTTSLLSNEVAEHGRWAVNKFQQSKGIYDLEVLKSISGKAGIKTNAFMEGFIEEVEKGKMSLDFFKYVDEICPYEKENKIFNNENIKNQIENENIKLIDPDQWQGFQPEDYAEIDEYEQKIKKIRQGNNTFTHDRQVKAEAEALHIIVKVRDKVFNENGKLFNNAFFVSHTRIVDDISNSLYPITMRPEALYQWLLSLEPIDKVEYKYLTNSLLRELVERNSDIINLNKINTVFAPLINASRQQLNEQVEKHKKLIAYKYGESAIDAFKKSNDYQSVIVNSQLNFQLVEDLQKELEEAGIKIKEAEQKVKLTAIQIKKIQKLEDKKRKNERKKRGFASRKKRK